MKKPSILVVDDESDIRSLLAYNLEKAGYQVTAASDGHEALHWIEGKQFDLIILDLMLPGMHGLELCRIIKGGKKYARIPIIMVTAKNEEHDKVRGLELGADDYLTKPFSPKELLARIKAVLRRTGTPATSDRPLILGDLSIDASAFIVTKQGRRLHLSTTEFNLLLYLAQRRGRVFSRDQLLEALGKTDECVDPRTVDVHIRRLRTQIEDDPADPVYIKTRRGVGYLVESE